MTDAGAPAAFDRLKAATRRANGEGALKLYLGSPLLIARALRPADRYIACEIRPDDYAALKAALPRGAGAVALKEDGWAVAATRTPAAPARALVLIDPPFERADDYAQVVATTRKVLARNRGAVLAIWLPIKDLATYDAFLGEFEDAVQAPALVVETRLRPLTDPMKMNGCAMIVVNSPADLAARSRLMAEWICSALGETGSAARMSLLNA
jgi:23S rRNA (adenine2030-N6)-methyltransferase